MLELVLSLIPLLTISAGTCQDKQVDVGGYYNKETQKIRICKTKDPVQNAYSLFHEIGHHYWYTQMNDLQRQGYIDLFDKSEQLKDFTRPYSQTSPEEDFADTFGAMILDEWKNYGSRTSPMIERKRAYIKKLIK